MELDDGHGGGDGQNEDQVLQTWKRRKKKQNGFKAKLYLIEPFCFATQDTIKGVDGFRINKRTIKRSL
jgi:hypothetical protein